ncbi:MAG: hypothetical protein ACK5NB_00980 [Flavobacteriaceae bacterium]
MVTNITECFINGLANIQKHKPNATTKPETTIPVAALNVLQSNKVDIATNTHPVMFLPFFPMGNVLNQPNTSCGKYFELAYQNSVP